MWEKKRRPEFHRHPPEVISHLQTLGSYDSLDDGPDLPARLGFLPAPLYHVTHLTRRPDGFARSSGNRVGKRMDVLSTVFKTVKLEGAMFYTGSCCATRSITQSSAAADSCGSAGKPMQLKPVLRVSGRLCERYLPQWQIRPPDRGWAGDFQRSSIRL